MKVELKYGAVPTAGLFAVHYWFVTEVAGKRERWEVWQRPNVGGESMGHLHRNLMPPDAPIGGGPTQFAQSWTGEAAERLVKALRESWDEYPYRDRYRMVRGPNSNSYVAWVLKRAGVPYRLSWKGIGRNYKFE